MGQDRRVWVSPGMPRPRQSIPAGDSGERASSLDMKPFFSPTEDEVEAFEEVTRH